MNKFSPGSLVRYRRVLNPYVGIIINETNWSSEEQRFYNVLLENGVAKLISTHYLDFLQ